MWSDRAFDAEFDACTVSRDASSNRLLYELIRHRAALNAIVPVEQAIADKNMPVVLLNPEFFPKEELEELRARTAFVGELGRGARRPYASEYVPIPAGTPPFPGMPNEDSCYWKRPIPQNMPQDIAIERTADKIARYATPFTADVRQEVRVFGYRMANGRLAVFGRNETDAYLDAKIGFDVRRGTGLISDVLVHSDFPSLPVKTILQVRIAPRDTVFLSVGTHDSPMPSAPTE